MEMTGERRIPAPRQRVWDALNDPEVLRASIPGCESVEREGEDQFKARVALKIGPMSAKFAGKVKLENINAARRLHDHRRRQRRRHGLRQGRRRRRARGGRPGRRRC